MILPAILLLLILVGLGWLHFSGNQIVPLQVLLILMALGCVLWYLKSSDGNQPTSLKLEATKSVSIGYMLAKESLEQLVVGDEVVLLTTSFPAWKDMSEGMVKGAEEALKKQDGLTVRTIDVTTLEGGKELKADGLTVLRSVAPQLQGVDAIITAFPMMGENLNPRVLPKLPPVYGYYDGNNMNWLNLVNKKYFHGVSVPMLWREKPTDEPLNELEALFRQEYILVTPENLSEFSDLR